MLDYNLVTVRDISVVILAFKLGHFCVKEKSLQKAKHGKMQVKYQSLEM
jgi:hypothetical protein